MDKGTFKRGTENRNWRRTAHGRLKFELAGIAFARKTGLTPEDWARHLWSEGAAKWMGKPNPTAAEYLLKEAEAFRILYPEVSFKVAKLNAEESQLVFTRGCLGGWGKDQWSMARGSGLGKGHVCRYCREAFRVWSRQIGLETCPEPRTDGTCTLQVKRMKNEES
ncbi:MAG: hypothetical protein HYX83_00280, partial [Chloroflexi bacterium]|nr:hypothetical protein [Chloroflexota bacterium]